MLIVITKEKQSEKPEPSSKTCIFSKYINWLFFFQINTTTIKFKNWFFTRAVLRAVVLPGVVHYLLEVADELLVVVVHVVLDLVLHVLQAHRLLHVPVVVVHLVRVHQLQEDVSELLECVGQ